MTIEMHVCKFSMGSEKRKSDKIMSTLFNNWFKVSVLRKVVDALGKLLDTREASINKS